MMLKKLVAAVFILTLVFSAFGQRARKSVVFAVLNDGKTIEPIAYLDKGALTQAIDNTVEAPKMKAFHTSYYKLRTTYSLFFGGANAGTVTVTKADPKAECTANMAGVTSTTSKTKLGGFVMGLATNFRPATAASGVRRRPTANERAEVEKLVLAEYATRKVKAGELRYHNLTAVDADGDKNVELIGSYWSATSPDERTMLFFIAEKNAAGKYELAYGDFRTVKKDEVMSGEISALDNGVYHELLLDLLDTNGDGKSEVFTYTQGFEGSTFNVYKKDGAKWSRSFETANYHCGF